MTTPLPFGYRLVRQGTANLPPACPPSYVAVAGCLCPAAIPDSDAIPLYGSSFQPEPLAEKWDIPLQAATALFRFNEAHVEQIDYPSLTYRDLGTARLARSAFFPGRPDVLLLGLGAVDDAFRRYPGIRDVSPFPPDARLLGFDLYEFGDFAAEGAPLPPLDFSALSMGFGCPLFCCDPDAEIPARLGISLNARGLYPDAPAALAAAGPRQPRTPRRTLPLPPLRALPVLTPAVLPRPPLPGERRKTRNPPEFENRTCKIRNLPRPCFDPRRPFLHGVFMS